LDVIAPKCQQLAAWSTPFQYRAIGTLRTIGRVHGSIVREVLTLSEPGGRDPTFKVITRLNDFELKQQFKPTPFSRIAVSNKLLCIDGKEGV
jgi:hypothetical protein